MKYLVLGSEGQIGKPLVKYLKDKGHNVKGIDIVNDIYTEDLRHISEEQFEKFSSVDFVYFLAFDVGGSRYLKEYEKTFDFIHNNISIMKNVFYLLKGFNLPFIFASRQMANMNWSSYGCLKAMGEKYTNSMNGRNVHFWNVYGPEYDEKKFHVISDFISQAKKGEDIQLLTDGSECRQMLYVDDCCEALYKLSVDFKKIPNIPLHITSFEWVTIKEIADIIANHFKVTWIPGKSNDEVQKDKRNEPCKEILSYWQPKVDINSGIKRVIEVVS